MTDRTDRSDDVVDELPDDLVPTSFSGAYRFPDNDRRRVPASIYLILGLGGLVSATVTNPRVNDGFMIAGVGLIIFAVYGFIAGRSMAVDERSALTAAQRELGFPVGHASAQQVWHGLTSRPTWRVLAYSAEEPPRQRALVLVDALNGDVIEHLVEDNPEQDVI